MPDKLRVLFLSANPERDTQPLRSETEARAIREELNRSRFQIDLRTDYAMRIDDISRVLLDFEPSIIHFSGHGESNKLLFEDDRGRPAPVTANGLAAVLTSVRALRVILLNACESVTVADGLRDVAEYVIGIDGRISDHSAILFATGFYRTLASGKSSRECFEGGVAELRLHGLRDAAMPRLMTRERRPMRNEVQDEPRKDGESKKVVIKHIYNL